MWNSPKLNLPPINDILFVSDLDGTLLNTDGKVSGNSVRILNEAINKGACFSVATARTPSTVSILLEDLNLNVPLVVMTGAALWNTSDGRFLDPVTMSPQLAKHIAHLAINGKMPTFIYHLYDNVIHIRHIGPLSDLEENFIAERTQSPYKVFHFDNADPWEMPADLNEVALFYAMQPDSVISPVYDKIKESLDCNPLFYHDIYGTQTGILEVFAPGASKASGVRRLQKLLNKSFVVAFGDNINDIPMFEVADMAVAVENACPQVKEAADIIIGNNNSHSVARCIHAIVTGNTDSIQTL